MRLKKYMALLTLAALTALLLDYLLRTSERRILATMRAELAKSETGLRETFINALKGDFLYASVRSFWDAGQTDSGASTAKNDNEHGTASEVDGNRD